MGSVSLTARIRAPIQPTPRPPMLVLLHGLAADEHDLFGMAADLDPRFQVITLRGPYEAGYGGYAWFGLQFLPDGRRLVDERQAVAGLDILIKEIESLVEAHSPSKLILAGFSQGAMMAAAVALRRPELIQGAWLMSSRYLRILDPGTKPSKALPIYMQHGLYDEVLRVAEGRELATVLKSRGHVVVFDEYAMGHESTYQSLVDADNWLRVLLG